MIESFKRYRCAKCGGYVKFMSVWGGPRRRDDAGTRGDCRTCGLDMPVVGVPDKPKDSRVTAEPTPLWWLSFVDTTQSAPVDQQQPGMGGFLGVVIVQADTVEEAITISHLTGVNPGGQVASIGPLPAAAIGTKLRGRLLTADEAMQIPEPSGM